MAEILQRRCQYTKNLCGTDTWAGVPCPCLACQIWVLDELNRLNRQIQDLEAELYVRTFKTHE